MPKRKASRGLRWRGVLRLGALLPVLMLGTLGARLPRALVGERPGSLSVVQWNMSSPWPKTWHRYKSAFGELPEVDIIALTNTLWGSYSADLAASRGMDHIYSGRLAIMVSGHVLESGWISLGLTELGADYSGALLWARLQPEHIDQQVIVWLVDMPSGPTLGRTRLARAAREAIDAAVPPAPDIVVGDLNVPRGANSTRILLGDGEWTHAFDEAGWGYAATWPRHRPLLHIDHAFTGARWRSLSYRVIDPGISGHLAQLVGVEPIE